jgi:hypothetical protein
MGYVPSAATVTATAYLTELGRQYLFNKGNIRFVGGVDLFQVTQFGMGDPDVNYNTGTLLSTGEIPDITGETEGCLKTAANVEQQSLIFYDTEGITPRGNDPITSNPQYVVDGNGGILDDGITFSDPFDTGTLPVA